jgi:hypothetical protein
MDGFISLNCASYEGKINVEVTVHQILRVAILFLVCGLYPCVITTLKPES